ncbi:GNAT family N-acetyltransferase [Streptomyces massasporeus]|uniref:GNAT family N-acetyltransferase n=1 Tax=Streptomyces massasporeus TaxID=67324 RepID=UPI0036F7F389
MGGGGEAHWAVAEAESGGLLGRVALRDLRLADGTAEVAYWTAPQARLRGVAARATTALTHWALDEIGFPAWSSRTPGATRLPAVSPPGPASPRRAPSAVRSCSRTAGTTRIGTRRYGVD